MRIEDIILKIRDNQKQLGITLYPAATNKEIEDWEKKMKMKFPEDLKTFYKFCNGFESEKDLFRIIPLQEIYHVERVGLNKFKDYRPNQFDIAEYMTYSDTWRIEVNPVGKNMYTVFNGGSKRRTLTSCFADFLECFLTNEIFGEGGLYDWHKEIDKL
jgi:hypothetical protein